MPVSSVMITDIDPDFRTCEYGSDALAGSGFSPTVSENSCVDFLVRR